MVFALKHFKFIVTGFESTISGIVSQGGNKRLLWEYIFCTLTNQNDISNLKFDYILIYFFGILEPNRLPILLKDKWSKIILFS